VVTVAGTTIRSENRFPWPNGAWYYVRVSEDHDISDGAAGGPVCPGCRQPLRGNLRQELLEPRRGGSPGPARRRPAERIPAG